MEHIDIPAGERHPPQNWQYADAAARLAASPTDGVGGVALQLDTHDFWRLVSIGPVVWKRINAGGDIAFNFSYGDSSPALLTRAFAGERVHSVQVTIDVAFNGAGSALSVGTLATPDLLVPAALLDPSVAVSFEFSPQELFGANVDLYLFLTPGAGASSGSGSIILQRQ